MKNKISLWVFLLSVMAGYSQIISIKDAGSGQPLELVSLSSNQPKVYKFTNAQGEAEISSFSGSEAIEIRLIGYKTLVKSYQELSSGGFILSMTPAEVSLDQVVVSATRWNQTSKEVPHKITVITPKDVALQNPQTMADLLGTSGEVFIQKSQQGGGSPMIRGFATNRLLYTVDGVRMNTAIFRGGNLQNVISLDPFATESTEVLFGAGSVIYGSDAIGGVMSFQTLTPQLAINEEPLVSGRAVVRVSSANEEQTGHFDVFAGWKKWALVSSITYSDYGDLKMGSNGPDDYLRPFYVDRQNGEDVVITNPDPLVQNPTGYSQINFMQKIRFKPNENWDFQYGFHYSETSDYARYDRLTRTRNGLPRSAEWYYGPQRWVMNNLNVTNQGDHDLYDEVTLRLAHQYFEESRVDRNFNSVERAHRIEKVNAYSVNIDLLKRLSDSGKLFYGLEWVRNDVKSTGIDEDIATGIKATGPARYPESDWSSYALYASYQHQLSEQLMLQAGARYNHFVLNADFSNNLAFYPFPFSEAEIDKGALTGSLGAVYKPASDWVLSATLSTGFRSPNVDDVGKIFDSEPGSVVVPNPDLDAEYAYNAEVGITKVFGDFLKLDITGYYTYLDNALVRRDFTLNGSSTIEYDGEESQVQAIQNAAVAKIRGIQAGAEVKIASGLTLSTRYNYQKGEEEVDDGTTSPSRHAAPWFGVTRFAYTAGKLNSQLYAMYSGKRKYSDLPQEEQGKTEIYALDASGNPYSPSWYTLNFKSQYQITENFLVSAGLENITDQRYRTYSSGIASAGRNFILSVSAKF